MSIGQRWRAGFLVLAALAAGVAAAQQSDASRSADGAFSAFALFAIAGAVLIVAVAFFLLSPRRRANRRSRQGAGIP